MRGGRLISGPRWIAMEVTRRCNLRCVHCRSSSESEIVRQPFSTAHGEGLLDQIAEYGDPVVVLTGGEPLLRDDLFDLIQHGSDRGLRMCLATNGSLLTTETVRAMRASGVRMVSLSLDGADAAAHDDFRQQEGSFEATLRAAVLLREGGQPFLVNSSFSRHNESQAPAVKRLAKEIGAVAWYMFLIVPTGRAQELLDELVSRERYEELLQWHYDAEREESECEEAMLMRPTCAPHYYRIWHQRASAEGRTHERQSLLFSTGGGKGCIAGQRIALIDVDGDVRPCSYFPLSAGNVREQPLKEIWEHAPLLLALRDPERLRGACGACRYKHVCGGCRARAYHLEGDYLAADPMCDRGRGVSE